MASSDFVRMLSGVAIGLAAALAGCRKALVGTGWSAVAGPFLTLLAQTGSGTTPLAL